MHHTTPRHLLAVAALAATIVAACATAGEDVATSADPTTTTSTTTAAPPGPPADADEPPLASDVDETLVLDRGPGAPRVANQVPAVGPDDAIGRIGFTRYVYVEAAGAVIPSLVEGPVGEQVRCQAVAEPCSADDLRALAATGAEPPPAWQMTVDDLALLVDQLDAVDAELANYPDGGAACAAGFVPDRTQTPNMGSHFTSFDRIFDGEFDPAAPEIIMMARVDGLAPDGPLGRCRADGTWDGVDVEPVGVAFFQPFAFVGDDHIDGFAGPLDNWHVHYNLCRLDGRDITVPPDVCAGTVGEFEPSQVPVGDASEGWMLHAWAARDFDAQLGVFSMWNPSVWPVTDPTDVAASSEIDARRGGGAQVIDDFTLPDIDLDEPGTITFFNADDAAHNVTAGTPASPLASLFDSGIVDARSASSVSVDADGEVPYFCSLHPDMQGTIRVG